jgi:hypothetical protein
MTDETDDEMIGALPAMPAVDPLGLLSSMLTMINSARQCERRVRELRRETAAAEKAKQELAGRQTEIAAERAAFDQYKAAELAKIQVLADRAQVRMDVAEATEDSFAERERRIYEKEQHWKFTDEDDQVRSGFREPENGTGLEKARRFYGIDPPLEDADEPTGERRLSRETEDGTPLRADTTITADIPVRTRPDRAQWRAEQ